MKDQDSIFFKNFSIMLGGLILLTIILAIVGYIMHNNLLGDDVVIKDRTMIEKMIEPVAKVNTGELKTVTTAIADPEIVERTEEVSAPTIAFEGSTDGKMIYNSVCMACHMTGAAGAPKLETADWAGRLGKGLDGLTESAINGMGVMPPKGGRADLSDEQIKVTVEFMIKGL